MDDSLASSDFSFMDLEPVSQDSFSMSSTSTVSNSANLSKKTKRKRKSNPDVASGFASSHVEKGRNMRNTVLNILEKRHPGFTDLDFGEKALMNLARKVVNEPNRLDAWEKTIIESSDECIPISRSKDGRMTVAKANITSSKKVFPQIILCQIFRWPDIVFWNEIRSTSNCQAPASIKPQDSGPDTQVEEICINPAHYELTHASRPNKPTNKEGVSGAGRPRKATKARGPDETTPQDFDSQGVDYIKLWNDQANLDDSLPLGQFERFDPDVLLKEVKFLSIEDGQTLSEEMEQKLGLRESLKVIIDGDYLKESDDAKASTTKTSEAQEVPKIVPVDDPPPDLNTSDAPLREEDTETVEDSTIQNLLDDIRGSFERQFDDEFSKITTDDISADEALELLDDLTGAGPSSAQDSFQPPHHHSNVSQEVMQSSQHQQHQPQIAFSQANTWSNEPPCVIASSSSISQQQFDNLFPSDGQAQQQPMYQQHQMQQYQYQQQQQHEAQQLFDPSMSPMHPNQQQSMLLQQPMFFQNPSQNPFFNP